MPVEYEQLLVWDYDEAQRLATEALEEIGGQIRDGARADWASIEKLISSQERMALLGMADGSEEKAKQIADQIVGQLIRNEVHVRSVSLTERAICEIRAREWREFARKYGHDKLGEVFRVGG